MCSYKCNLSTLLDSVTLSLVSKSDTRRVFSGNSLIYFHKYNTYVLVYQRSVWGGGGGGGGNVVERNNDEDHVDADDDDDDDDDDTDIDTEIG